MAPAMSYVGEKPVDEIELHVYLGDGSFTLFDDDGVTTKYLQGEYAAVPVQVSKNQVKVGKLEGNYTSKIKTIIIVAHMDGTAKEVARVPFGDEAYLNI